jgi:putative DNA primase/helicase
MPDHHGFSADPMTALRLALLANGYRPVPVAGPKMRVGSPGKQPVMKDWPEICATADEAEVRRWATAERGCSNTGLLCGSMAGVDIDVPVPDLAERIKRAAIAILGPTPLRRVGRAPKVLLAYRTTSSLSKMATPEFFLPDGTKVQVEVLAAGQQFVAYGIHPDTGQEYEWTGEGGPDVVPLDELPAVAEVDLRDFVSTAERMLRTAGGRTKAEIDAAAKAAVGEPEPKPAAKPKATSAPPGADGDSFFRQVNRAALDDLAAWVPVLFPRAKLQGTGAYRIGSADLGRDYEEDLSIHPKGVQDFGPRKGLSPCDVVQEFGSAPDVKAAAFKLCEWLGRDPAGFGWKEARKAKAEPPPGKPKDEAGRQEKPQERKARSNNQDGRDLTEDGIALTFAAEHAGRVAFDHTERRWAEWDGCRWRRDGKERVFNGVREYVRRLREGRDAVPSALARMGFASAVERGVRADQRIAVEHEVWDADPWTLGVPGGVVDLRTGTLRAGRPEEYISRQTGVAPAAPGTPAPLWHAFLAEATGRDAETIAFLRRFIGYSLTGDVSEEVLAFLYGAGGNGKGVFLGVWTAILGDYAVSMPMEAFTANGGAKLEYYRARMAGHRLVTASETETGATWAESQIKELTGNEAPVSARHPHGRPFEYRPQFKLAFVGNHAPRLKGRSAAMERRLRVVPFDRAPSRPDHALKAKLRAEYPAILRWMLEGCLEWQRDRLGTSPAIAKATGSYFEAQDAFGRWLEEACVLDSSLATRPAPLLAAFGQWAKASGETTPSAAEFAELVDRHPALTRTKSNGARLVKGIGLRSSGDGRTWGDD